MARTMGALLAVALLGGCLTACGAGGRRVAAAGTAASSSVAESPALRKFKGDEDDDDTHANHTPNLSHDNDTDFDNDSKATQSRTYFDDDDAIVRDFGQPANASDARAITTLVERYNTATAAADGARACSLIYSLFAEAIPEDYGNSASPAYARGKTCAVVLTKIFRHDHRRFGAVFQVTGVRVSGKRAFALLGSTKTPASYIALQRERGIWKVNMPFVRPLR